MCGIIGIAAASGANVSPLLMEGLKRLEYRGYDSAGIATLSGDGALSCRRSEGKLARLEQKMYNSPIQGDTGIGHTRWATHGRATSRNAHPHSTEKVSVVHNGIIENFQELRARLKADGRVFLSDTDTEVIPHLITQFLEEKYEPVDAVRQTLRYLCGTFALAVLFAGHEKFIVVARRGSPLAIGYGEQAMFVGSDAIAISPFTSSISYLEDGDVAQIRSTGVDIWDSGNKHVTRHITKSQYSEASTAKNGHRHFTLKEINEQPEVLAGVLRKYTNSTSDAVLLPVIPLKLEALSHITLVACGTSYYAGMVGKYWLEKFARLSVTLDVASEFRHRDSPLQRDGLSIFISQSGETADTLAALHFARECGQHILGIVNVNESSMARASDVVLPTFAGAEIGVASTKAFTSQLMALACFTLQCAKVRKTLDADEIAGLLAGLNRLPDMVREVIVSDRNLIHLAKQISTARSILFIGRGTCYPVALEGALKMKELSYIHSEGLAAGELKHGSIALIDEDVPVIALAPSDILFEKTCSNIQEVSARGGKVIAFCSREGARKLAGIASETVVLPDVTPLLVPFVFTIPLQLLAYHVALARGNDVDQPRNLAKSVTVE